MSDNYTSSVSAARLISATEFTGVLTSVGEELSWFPFFCHRAFASEHKRLERAVKSKPPPSALPTRRIQDVEVPNVEDVVVVCRRLYGNGMILCRAP